MKEKITKGLNKVFIMLLLLLFSTGLTGCGDNGDKETMSRRQEENQSLSKEKNILKSQVSELESQNSELSSELESVQTELSETQDDLKEISEEYDAYKTKMSEYETLSEAEAEARQIEADRIIAEEEEEKKRQEEEKKAAEEQARKEAEEQEKIGYNTGITYDQLARTPDDYKGEKVKFTGKVIQVLEGDTENDLRMAVNSDYDDILYLVYSKDIVSSRVLEDDIITIYGVSYGIYTYESTMGGMITIPLVFVDKIDQ